jgi:4-amino-4-deoxychorismate lyase
MSAAGLIAAVASGPGGPLDVAAVPVTDLAILRGEGVFDTTRLYDGRPFRLGAHLDRLEHSAAAVGITVPRAEVERLAKQAAEAAGGRDGALRVLVTKGPEDGPGWGIVAAIATEIPEATEEERAAGLVLAPLTQATDPLIRSASPWLLPAVKSISYAVNMAARRRALELGASDAVFTGLGGELLETPTANVWWRSGSTLFTPSLDTGILAGVTRAALLELAPAAGYRVVEGVFGVDDLLAADEAFESSSIRELMPVIGLTGAEPGQPARPIGDGRPGPAMATLLDALRALGRS